MLTTERLKVGCSLVSDESLHDRTPQQQSFAAVGYTALITALACSGSVAAWAVFSVCVVCVTTDPVTDS
eukprot:13988787-Alexandrium_andersonii.AAC.1